MGFSKFEGEVLNQIKRVLNTLFFLLLGCVTVAYAQDSLGGVSDNVLGPVGILMKMFSVASILAGVAF